jgi:hypothetical protein
MLLRHRLNNHLLWTPPVFKKDIPTVTAYSIHRADHSPYPSVGDDNGIHAADFAEYAFLYEKAWTSDSSVRQVLAHIPTYMIFDDHEITDDWNFSDNWQQIVHNDRDPYRYWPKTMTDGLAAYWIYQGWGNLPPSKWSGEHSDVRARFLTDARDQETDALVKLRPLLLEHSVKPAGEMQWHGGLAWHYELPLSPRFLVMDLRSRRLVKRRSDEFEGRVPLHIMDAEGQSIDPDQLRWMQDRLAQSPLAVAFVVTSTPFLVPPFVSFAQRWPEVLTVIEGAWETEVTRRRRDFEHMVSDKSWDEMRKVMVELHRKQRELKTIVCLSGDVHFSYNMSAHLSTQTHPFPEFVQLVCSAFKNARSPYEKKKLRQFTETLFSDNTYELKGLKVHQGGFADAAYRKRKILPENSVAIVDVHLATMGGQTSSSKQVILREQYLIDQTVPAPPSSRPADPNLPTFLYQTTDSGSIMTQPESE